MSDATPGVVFLEGAYYGLLLAMVVHEVFVGLSLRQRSHLLYAGFLAAFALSTFTWDGHARRWLWPSAERWDATAAVALDAITLALAIAFTRAFLDMRARLPRLERWLRTLGAVSLATLPLTSAPRFADALVSGFAIVATPLLIASGVACMRSGAAHARAYLGAVSVLLLGLAVETVASFAWPVPPAWAEMGTYAGSVVMAVTFSRGLALRHRESLRECVRLEEARRSAELASWRDGLTELWNRRRLDVSLDEEWRRAARDEVPLSLLLVDVDFFKAFNDRYGHLAGDECLRRIARALEAAAVRPSDLAARYGGEEFALLLPNADAAGAARVAERLRECVAAAAIPHAGSSVAPRVTVSVGIATTSPDSGEDPKQLVDAADLALYRAKQEGRDCARASRDPAWIP